MLSKLRIQKKFIRENKKSRVAQQNAISTLNLSPFALDVLQQYKHSDVLYILGSGDSICTLDRKQWSQIAEMDSLGMNFWTIHPHVPSFYTFETPRAADNCKVMMSNLLKRAPEYSKTAFLFKCESTLNDETVDTIKKIVYENQISMFVPTYITVSDESQLIYMLQNYNRIVKSFRKKFPDILFRKRASVVFATMLGYDLGYKDIVFCGIDGVKNSGYFYEKNNQDAIFSGICIPKHSGQKKNAIHRTMDPDTDSLTADRCLRLIYEHLFSISGINMWVGTPNSILSDWMPAWKWDT